MKNRSQVWTCLVSMIFLFVLILDAKTAFSGMRSAIDQCIHAVIPSLFPFFVISSLICAFSSSVPLQVLKPVGRLTNIPYGGELFLLIGLLGGYPVGAQTIAAAYKNKTLSKSAAQRMLGFCSNAGPSFIFGIIGCQFLSPIVPWVLWLIHIASAIIVGMLLPNKQTNHITGFTYSDFTISDAVEKSVKVMANVCGWILIFRVIVSFLQKWILWLLPREIVVCILSLLELTIGTYELSTLSLPGLQFIIVAGSLGFGGLCVAMQTVSVTKGLGMGYYFPGKIIQGSVSILFAFIAQFFLFSKSEQFIPTVPFIGVLLAAFSFVFAVFLKRNRKNSSIYANNHI